MPSLIELQRGFVASTFHGETQPLSDHIEPHGIDAAARLQIHRNNSLITLTEALAATFPVVQRLVGDEFFAFMAGQYVETSPPAPLPLFQYGESLPEFIGDFGPAAELVYLKDVARLEWAVNGAYFAADEQPIEPQTLSHLPREDLSELGFRLHPSHRLVVSPYPIDRIWHANQAGGEEEPIALDSGAKLLVIRPFDTVEILPLANGAFNFVLALATGQPLHIAASAAEAADPAFDLTATMTELFTNGVFSATHPAPQTTSIQE